MNYKGNLKYEHDTSCCTGILITNLGTPDNPTASAVRKYLAEFLSDSRVIELPKCFWWFILHGIILRIRPSQSAKAYKKIWTENGSPLLSISSKQVEGLKKILAKKIQGPIRIELAMRYGNPSIKSGLKKLQASNSKRILILPLYPQYSSATTGSTFDAVVDELKKWRWLPEIRMVNHYHDHPGYIDTLANSIMNYWTDNKKPQKLLFSFHGLPKHYFLAGDPYHCECHKTARLVAEKLKLNEEEWSVTFQSRFGPKEWLQPYTDTTLISLANSGIKSVNIICPGFSADCLETLEEINIQNRDFFIDAGGESFDYIPALNEHPSHLELLCNIILQHTIGWPEFSSTWNNEKIKQDLYKSKELAEKSVHNKN
jgi:ferrochelatase